MNVRGGAAHVHNHHIPHGFGQNLGGPHDRSGRRHNIIPDYFPNVFHARRRDDMAGKHVLDDLADGVDIELIDARIHIFNYKYRHAG